MLERINSRRYPPREAIDPSNERRSLADLNNQHVLFSGDAIAPIVNGKYGRPYPGGPRYTVAYQMGNRKQAAIIQPYDINGELSPAEVGPARAINHVTAYQRPNDPAFRHLEPVYREADGAVVGAGVVREHPPGSGNYKIYEAPYGTASNFYNDGLLQIAGLPPEQRLQAADDLRNQLGERHSQTALAYDVSALTILDALERLDGALHRRESVTARLRALQLQQYMSPRVELP